MAANQQIPKSANDSLAAKLTSKNIALATGRNARKTGARDVHPAAPAMGLDGSDPDRWVELNDPGDQCDTARQGMYLEEQWQHSALVCLDKTETGCDREGAIKETYHREGTPHAPH